MRENEPPGPGGDVPFELLDSEYILNLDYYLHNAIMQWLNALPSALKTDKGIEVGLTNRGLAADMVVGISKAKRLVHWEILAEPTRSVWDKQREIAVEIGDKQKLKKDSADKEFKKEINTIRRNNREAKKFQVKLDKEKQKWKEKTDTAENVKNVKIADFQVFEILGIIQKMGKKTGVVIV